MARLYHTAAGLGSRVEGSEFRLYHRSGELLPSQMRRLPVISLGGRHVGEGIEGAALFLLRDEVVEQAKQRQQQLVELVVGERRRRLGATGDGYRVLSQLARVSTQRPTMQARLI